jgi:hypothetical protein
MIASYLISKKNSIGELNEVKVGDIVRDESGRCGIIDRIEVVTFKRENHFYFRLAKGLGWVLIIK